jgi:hypothetical protein
MDGQKIQQPRLPLGPERGVMPTSGQHARHRPLDHSHRDQRARVGGLDGGDLPARPFVGDGFTKLLVVHHLSAVRAIVLLWKSDGFDIGYAPRSREFFRADGILAIFCGEPANPFVML